MISVAMQSALSGLLSVTLTACAAVPVTRTPDLQGQARTLESRRLDDPGLIVCVDDRDHRDPIVESRKLANRNEPVRINR